MTNEHKCFWSTWPWKNTHGENQQESRCIMDFSSKCYNKKMKQWNLIQEQAPLKLSLEFLENGAPFRLLRPLSFVPARRRIVPLSALSLTWMLCWWSVPSHLMCPSSTTNVHLQWCAPSQAMCTLYQECTPLTIILLTSLVRPQQWCAPSQP